MVIGNDGRVVKGAAQLIIVSEEQADSGRHSQWALSPTHVTFYVPAKGCCMTNWISMQQNLDLCLNRKHLSFWRFSVV